MVRFDNWNYWVFGREVWMGVPPVSKHNSSDSDLGDLVLATSTPQRGRHVILCLVQTSEFLEAAHVHVLKSS